jgi:hypothetical protein
MNSGEWNRLAAILNNLFTGRKHHCARSLSYVLCKHTFGTAGNCGGHDAEVVDGEQVSPTVGQANTRRELAPRPRGCASLTLDTLKRALIEQLVV